MIKGQTKENVMSLFKAAFMWSKKYSDTHHQPLKEVLSPFLVYIQVLTSSICHHDAISLIRNHNGIAMVFISNWNPINVIQFHIILFYKDHLLESKPNVTSLDKYHLYGQYLDLCFLTFIQLLQNSDKQIFFQFHMIPANILMTEIHPLGLVPYK